ncbi:CotD family spore coat protein [Bacillus sp. ISL-39]|uniref:CotD family spore coat protein n=1 Tax=Bacillus sp. ISL-39 TaxID=2819124 RepID=UPI001BE83CBC|nr:CotD family spore coat protein [Bacillus sp. ISL-39]MBT2639055.1 spore coat protein CotD [Bacillus sp. ISL-39]
MHCKPTNVLPTVVHPTQCCVNNSFTNNVVPHVHPTHTTNVNHINYDHVHYFPQTQSTVNQVTHQNHYGGPGPVPGGVAPVGPRPRPGFGGPGFGGPGFGGPGFGGPGFGR